MNVITSGTGGDMVYAFPMKRMIAGRAMHTDDTDKSCVAVIRKECMPVVGFTGHRGAEAYGKF